MSFWDEVGQDARRPWNNPIGAITGIDPVADLLWPRDIPYDEAAANALVDMDRAAWGRFMSEVYPSLQEQMKNLGKDRSLIEQATKDTEQGFKTARQTRGLANARRGVNLSADQTKAMNKSDSMGKALAMVANKNNARLAQKDRNQQHAMQLASVGNTIRNIAGRNLASASGLSSSRYSQEVQDQANQTATNTSALATVAAAFI